MIDCFGATFLFGGMALSSIAALITRAIAHGRLLYRLEPLPSNAVRR